MFVRAQPCQIFLKIAETWNDIDSHMGFAGLKSCEEKFAFAPACIFVVVLAKTDDCAAGFSRQSITPKGLDLGPSIFQTRATACEHRRGVDPFQHHR